jgi:hypothetical protein
VTDFKGTAEDLREDQRINPIVWARIPPDAVTERLPKIDASFFEELWGAGRSRRIKTWGHLDGPLSAHWLALRGGTTLHTDPAFSRYSCQLQLYNEGFYTHGLDEDPEHYPPFTKGVVALLDTHSPHRVSRDPRLPASVKPSVKMSCAIDSVEIPDPGEAIAALLERLAIGPPTIPEE